MPLSLEELADRIEALEEEVQTLKLKNLDLTGRLVILEMSREECPGHSQTNNNSLLDKENSGLSKEAGDQKIVPAMTTTNPLETEKIVRRVMAFVKPKDLLKCRQVSKLWKMATQTDLEKRGVFHIRITMDNLYELEWFIDHALKSFPKFQNLKLNMKIWTWPENKNNIYKIFRNHGKFLHKLQLEFGEEGFEENWNARDLHDVFLSSLEEIRELKMIMSCQFIHESQIFYPHHIKKIMPKLTTLNLSIYCSDFVFDDNQRHGTTQVFTDLLSLAPNLQTLFYDSHCTDDPNSTHLFDSLLLINPPKLENLFLYSKISQGLACSIENSNLNLKQLYLSNFEFFQLHFVSSPPGKSEVTPLFPVYPQNISPLEMKTHLEGVLANCGEVSCVKLLQVFKTALASELTLAN